MDTALLLVGLFFVGLTYVIGCRAALDRWGATAAVLAVIPLICFAIVFFGDSRGLPWPHSAGALLGGVVALFLWERSPAKSRVATDA